MKRGLTIAAAAAAALAGEACVEPTTIRPESDWHPGSSVVNKILDVRAAAIGPLAPDQPFAVEGGDSALLSVRFDTENMIDQKITLDGVAMVPPCKGDLVFNAGNLYPGNISTSGCIEEVNPATFSVEVTVAFTLADGSTGEARYTQSLNLDVQNCAVGVWLVAGLLEHVDPRLTPSGDPLGAGPYDPSALSNDLSDLGLPAFDGLQEKPYDCATGEAVVKMAADMISAPTSTEGPCDMNGNELMTADQWTRMGEYNTLFTQYGLTLGQDCPVGKTPEGLDALEFVKSAWEL